MEANLGSSHLEEVNEKQITHALDTSEAAITNADDHDINM